MRKRYDYLGIYDVEWWTGGEVLTDYDPCNNWSQAGELVEKFNIDTVYEGGGKWSAEVCNYDGGYESMSGLPYSDTPTLAIVRAFVASKYGTEIDYDSIIGGE